MALNDELTRYQLLDEVAALSLKSIDPRKHRREPTNCFKGFASGTQVVHNNFVAAGRWISSDGPETTKKRRVVIEVNYKNA